MTKLNQLGLALLSAAVLAVGPACAPKEPEGATDQSADATQNQAKADETAGKDSGATAEDPAVAGEKFLAENAKKPGVVTLPSGLQYKIIKEGSGKKPTASDTVTCSYKGTLIDGTVFDASERHGGTAQFEVGGVIAGWTEALQLMPVGSKWQLFIPSKLAYGEQAMGADIPANSTLIFDIELISIK